jgi:hypothetical protein
MCMKIGWLHSLAFLLALAAAPALADSRMEKTLKLDPGGEFSIDTDLGKVTITGSSASGARVVITSRRELDDLLRFEFEDGTGRAAIRARKRHPVTSFFGVGNAYVRFEIEVPAHTAVKVHTSGGAISLSGTQSPATLHTSGGGIEVRDLQGDLEAETSGGSINLKDIRGKSNVETSGGSIDAVNLTVPFMEDERRLHPPTGSPATCACTPPAAGSRSGRPAAAWRPTLPAARSTRNSPGATPAAAAWSLRAAGSPSRWTRPSDWRSTPTEARFRATCP